MPKHAGAGASPPELAKFARFCSALELDTGGPMRLEPFQRAMLADYFAGATETLILLPKKNGKTTLLAALALYHLCSTVDAECVVGAASRDQASELYKQACKFVARSDGLQQRVAAKTGFREIRSRRQGDSGRIRVLAADVDTSDGVPRKPNSELVRAVLRRLEELGLTLAPRYLGVDEQGREIFSRVFAFLAAPWVRITNW